MDSLTSFRLMLITVLVLLVSVEGLNMPHLFHKESKKHKVTIDGMNKDTVVHGRVTAKKWIPSPAFEGRPRWNPVLAKLIKRYLSSQAKLPHPTKTNDLDSFIKIFNSLHKHGKTRVRGQKTFYVKPLKREKSTSMRASQKSLKMALLRLKTQRRQQIQRLREKAKQRHRRDIAAIAFSAGQQEEVIDPFDANHHLLKWEHGRIGIPNDNEGRYVDYTDGHYSPLFRNQFRQHRASVVNTNSVGFSGDFFGADITNGWNRKKRSLKEKSEQKKRSLYDKDFEDYGIDSYSHSRSPFRSYSNPMKSSIYGSAALRDSGLLYPVDSEDYFGMTSPHRRSKSGSSSRKKYKKPSGKYLGHSTLDFTFGNKQVEYRKMPDFHFTDFKDPVATNSYYGYFPDTKHDEYYATDKYEFPRFKNADRVEDTDYDDINMLPIGGIGYVKTEQSQSSTNTAADAPAAPVQSQVALVLPEVSGARTANTAEASTADAARTRTVSPVATPAPSKSPMMGKKKTPLTTQSPRQHRPTMPVQVPVTTAVPPSRTTDQRQGPCCKPCNSDRQCHYHQTSVTTTPCYKTHAGSGTTQSMPHYHQGQYRPTTERPHRGTTPKSIWSEFEIVGNVDTWMRSNKPPMNRYDEVQVEHGHKYGQASSYYGMTTPSTFGRPDSHTVSRIVTQTPGGYNYQLVQDIDIKVQHHPEGAPKITGTVELQDNGKNPRFVVKLPFAAGKLPLSIRKLIISRFTPSPLESGKSASMKMDMDCDPWNTTCMQEYADRLKIKDIDVIAELDPALIEKHQLQQSKNHRNDVRDSEERRPYEEFIDFSPEILPELETDEKLSEIQSSVPVRSDFIEPYYWQEVDESRRSTDDSDSQNYPKEWLSLTTPSPGRVRVENLPTGTPEWLRTIISKFVQSDTVASKPQALKQQWHASVAESIHCPAANIFFMCLILSVLGRVWTT